jgi:8-oxo-dGTP pyrophosphatase MutT (NUDIX family)
MRSGDIAVDDISIAAVARIDVGYAPCPWAFADARRIEIDAYFAALKRKQPTLWNGRVLMLRDFKIVDGVFRGAGFETDYASFVSWQDWNFPDRGVYDCFAMGCIQSSDGAVMLGVMAPHTFNAGQIYFPCGTPDPNDIAGDRIDFEGSVQREVAEETGLDTAEFAAEPGWHTLHGGNMIAHVKLLRAPQTAVELRGRILDHLAGERLPELVDVRVVRGPSDVDSMMPSFVTAFLQHHWSRSP